MVVLERKRLAGECNKTTVTDWSVEVKCDLDGLQSWCTKAFSLGCFKTRLLQLKKGKWREKLLSKWELRFTPNHTHFCWPDREAKQLLNKLSWQIPAKCFINFSSSKFARLGMGCNLVHQNSSDGLFIVAVCNNIYISNVLPCSVGLNKSICSKCHAIHCNKFQLGGIIKKNYQTEY